MGKNLILEDTKLYANRVDYYVNPKLLGEFKTAVETDRAVIERASNDYCAAVDDCKRAEEFLAKDPNEISVEEYEDMVALKQDAEDRKSKYIAVLIMKFWYTQAKMKKQCEAVTLYEYQDYYSQLFYCIDTAMKYRAWQNPEKHTNAQACINAAIGSRGAAEILYQSNLEKAKANANTVSFDAPVNSDSDDAETTLLDMIADDTATPGGPGYEAMGIVQGFVDRGHMVEAIIIDNIAFGDTSKVTKETVTGIDEEGKPYKYTVTSSAFWPFKLVKNLNNMESTYLTDFLRRYKTTAPEVQAALDFIEKASNTKLYTQVDRCIEGLRQVMLS